MDFSLTDEQRQYQALVRDFAEKEVAPQVKDYDREERYPVEIVRKMAARLHGGRSRRSTAVR
jgi:alkylation response protein AidB-like acyl-CoA dehydrogenase